MMWPGSPRREIHEKSTRKLVIFMKNTMYVENCISLNDFVTFDSFSSEKLGSKSFLCFLSYMWKVSWENC